jgi:hypothetical protein
MCSRVAWISIQLLSGNSIKKMLSTEGGYSLFLIPARKQRKGSMLNECRDGLSRALGNLPHVVGSLASPSGTIKPNAAHTACATFIRQCAPDRDKLI